MLSEPPSSPGEIDRAYLLAWLRRTELLLRRRARALHIAVPEQDDALLGLYISEAEAHRLLTQPHLSGHLHWDAAEEASFAEALAAAGQEIQQLSERVAIQFSPAEPRLDRVCAWAELDSFERDALLLALLPEVSLDYERLFGLLNNDVTRRRPSVELLLRLLCRSQPEAMARRACFATDARLMRRGLLTLGKVTDSGGSSLSQPVQVDQGLVAFLLDTESLDPRLAPWCAWSAHPLTQVEPQYAWGERSAVDRLAQELRRREPVICQIAGPRGGGRRTVAREAAQSIGQNVLIADLDRLPPDADLPLVVRLLFREASLRGAIPLWRNIDLGDEPRHHEIRRLALAEAAEHAGATVITTAAGWEVDSALRVWRTDLSPPDIATREQLWRAHLAGAADGLELHTLSAAFRLTPAQIAGATLSARRAAEHRDGPEAIPTLDDLFAAARARSRRNLGDLAQRVEARHVWDDLVLPPDQIERLREVCAYLRHRSTVLDQWGFGRTLPPNKGVSMLFAGPSGTGKTMSASLIALELGLDMFRIDLSTVVSKYIGETEKNLERIFQEGEDSNAILFFDEADALFGKRSEVRDAHDRYANIETAYLLQRMETYDGVVILATNLRRNLDDAFTRRLDFAVDFSLPEEEDRRRIWRNVIPDTAPLAGDVDLDALARRYKLSGGNIRNCAVAAAYLAAEEGGLIGMGHLLRAVRREHQKMGKLMQDEPAAPPSRIRLDLR